MGHSGRSQRVRRRLAMVHEDAAGLDVGATFHVVAVPADRDAEPVRTFQSFTADLHALAEWLRAVGIRTIAMESTGVYWIPVYEILEQRGFEVLLVNARDTRNVPGRKTDVNDAQWLQQLHQHGLLRGSFRPRDALARLRAYLRHRERLLEYGASHIQHMQKALMQMNVQLHHVVTDITGVTGMQILRAIVAGNHDPAALAALRDRRCKASQATLTAALTGTIARSISSPCASRWSSTTSTAPRSTRATPRSRRRSTSSTSTGQPPSSPYPACGTKEDPTSRGSTCAARSTRSSVPTSRKCTASGRTRSCVSLPSAATT
jgi:hypothetical protein